MLKKLMALTIIATMLLSSFCIIAQAEYGYDYWELICGRSKTTTYSPLANYRAYMRGSYVENAMGKYYIYDDNGRMGDDYYFQLNNQTSTRVMKHTEHLFELDTTTYAGKSYYSKGTGNSARMKLLQPSTLPSDWGVSSTMTWNFNIKYENSFVLTNFTACTNSTTDRTINLFRITSDGVVQSGPHSFNTYNIGQLSLGMDYNIGLVIKFIPTETSGSYKFTKYIYVNDELFYSADGSSTVNGDLKFKGIHIDAQPWAKAASTGADDYAIDTTYVNTTTLTESLKNSVYKYTIVGTHFVVDDFTVYAGNKYAKNQPSLANADSDFYVSSNIRNNTNYVTVAVQTASGDETESGTLMLATYNANKELVSIKTAALGLTAGAITEQDIDISTEDANETKLFIVTNTGNVTPLAKSTVLN